MEEEIMIILFQEALKEFFSEFGPVHQLNILRDKSTGVSRFVAFHL